MSIQEYYEDLKLEEEVLEFKAEQAIEGVVINE